MIPEGWKLSPIKDLCECIIDCVNKTAPVVDYKTPYKMIRTTNVRDGKVDTDNVRYVEKETYEIWVRRGKPKNGDLILTREAPVGEVGIIKNADGVFLGQRTVMYRAHSEKSNNLFLLYSLQTPYCKKQIDNFSNGGTVAHMRVPDCEKIILRLPPVQVQTRIANILSTWGKSIEIVENLIENSRTQKKALMQQLLTGTKRLPSFDGEWKNYQLTEVAQIIVSPVDKKSEADELPVELCNYTDVYYNTRITRHIEFMKATAKQSEIDKYALIENDVVITKDSETPGDIAVPALVSEDLNGVVCGYHLAIVRPKANLADGAYINYLFSMPKTRYYFFTLATGATRFGLSVGGINKAHFKLPPLSEQRSIVNILTNADHEIETLHKKLDLLKQEKKSLMQQLLTGKRRVTITEGIAK